MSESHFVYFQYKYYEFNNLSNSFEISPKESWPWFKFKNLYFISETFYNKVSDDISHKKVRLLLQHIVGLKTEGDKFTDKKLEQYDEIYYYDGIDFFNLSPIEGLKFFIEKNDENPDTIKIFFYDIKDDVDIVLNVDEDQSHHKLHNYHLINLGFTKFDMKQVSIEYNGINYDLTEIIKNIKHNELNIS